MDSSTFKHKVLYTDSHLSFVTCMGNFALNISQIIQNNFQNLLNIKYIVKENASQIYIYMHIYLYMCVC